MKFSANLGFLWADLPLPDAIRAADQAGFDAVEMHWPFDSDQAAVRRALCETGLPLLGLNTFRGGPGFNGLAALPDKKAECRVAIDQAFDWAQALGANNVHVMAGFASGTDARATFLSNLQYASDLGKQRNIGVLIEPLNAFDAPGYYLSEQRHAVELITELDRPNVRLMFDCYHVGRTEGDICGTFDQVRHWVGHVQFASVPNRSEPDSSLVPVLRHIERSGYTGAFGAEYKPAAGIRQGLSWLELFQ